MADGAVLPGEVGNGTQGRRAATGPGAGDERAIQAVGPAGVGRSSLPQAVSTTTPPRKPGSNSAWIGASRRATGRPVRCRDNRRLRRSKEPVRARARRVRRFRTDADDFPTIGHPSAALARPCRRRSTGVRAWRVLAGFQLDRERFAVDRDRSAGFAPCRDAHRQRKSCRCCRSPVRHVRPTDIASVARCARCGRRAGSRRRNRGRD